MLLKLWRYFTKKKMKPWFLYHLDNQGLIVDKVDLELYKTDWGFGKDKAIFPKMAKGDTVVATQKDMPIGACNWELSLYCQDCKQYHCNYEACK
jgi:hypothetical protein